MLGEQGLVLVYKIYKGCAERDAMADALSKRERIVVLHEVPKCIGCGSCVAMAPKFWKMDSGDSKAHLIGSDKVGENEELELKEAEVQENQDAADTCPVNCIHVQRRKAT